jgi:tetratricopeptide (TPR) repeat protein
VLASAYEQTKEQSYMEEAQDILAKAIKAEPYYKPFLYRQVQFLQLDSNYQQSTSLIRSAIPNYPWDMGIYEMLAQSLLQEGIQHLNKEQLDQTQARWDEAFALLGEIELKAKALEHLPEAQLQGRNFGLTQNLAFPLGQIFLFRGEFDQAEEYLRMRVDPQFDEQMDVQAAMYYLATLRKQGKDDAALYDSLIAAIGTEQRDAVDQQIAGIVGQQTFPK